MPGDSGPALLAVGGGSNGTGPGVPVLTEKGEWELKCVGDDVATIT